MSIAYVNGRYVPRHRAMVMMEDRGYQFADGLYEVAMFYNRQFLDWDLHLKRLHYSCDELGINRPMSDAALRLVVETLINKNAYDDGYVYLQITRGVAKRNHFYKHDARPVLTMSIMPYKGVSVAQYEQGIKVITVEDLRWKRCDIKSIALLPNILALQQAADAGAKEVFMFNQAGNMTECGKSTAFIVKDNAIYTHPTDRHVLPGVRKAVVRELCHTNNIAYHETDVPRDKVMQADEAFLTSATADIMPVTQIDDVVLGNGKIGALTQKLLTLYQAHVHEQTGKHWQ
jgi:D-alanine transaminase